MINITLIAVGKLKEKYLRDAVDEYSKRLGAFCKINIIEIDEEKIGDNPSSAQIQNVIEKEGQRIIKKIPKSSNIISLCIEGCLLYTSYDKIKNISKIILIFAKRTEIMNVFDFDNTIYDGETLIDFALHYVRTDPKIWKMCIRDSNNFFSVHSFSHS